MASQEWYTHEDQKERLLNEVEHFKQKVLEIDEHIFMDVRKDTYDSELQWLRKELATCYKHIILSIDELDDYYHTN